LPTIHKHPKNTKNDKHMLYSQRKKYMEEAVIPKNIY